MGLDMYLTARKFTFMGPERLEDGLPVKVIEMELAYWRKHPDLHGFIVQTFADGEDNCQNIDLDVMQMNAIIEAIQEERLPKTEGFFFGTSPKKDSDDADERQWFIDQKAEDLAAFGKAIGWLTFNDDKASWRSVYYRASW